MTFLLIAAIIAAMILLYATDRILKSLARARWYRAMSDRLDAAAARTEEQQEQRKRAAAASAALTSVMPAIKRPPLTIPGMTRRSQPHPADRPGRPGEKQAHAGEGSAHPRPRRAERPGRAGHGTGPRQAHPG
jgi:hypothetical protein